MTSPGRRQFQVAVALAATLSCTNAQLYDLGEKGIPPVDRQVQLQGQFCTLGPNEVISPIKILFIMDASGSMRRSDPTGSRATAIVNLIESLPPDPNIYFAVMLFAGFDTRFFTKSGTANYDQIISYSQTDLDSLVLSILNYTNTTATGPNVGNTDFVKPITTAYAMIDNDIANAYASATDGGIQIAPSRYISIFLSDGAPTIPQDPAIIQAVQQLVGLAEVTESCVLDTVHISPTPNNTCYVTDAGVLLCSALQFAEDAQRLQLMAQIGGGQFRDFQNGEPINFLSFGIGAVRRTYVLKDFYASNFTAPADSPPDQVDSDSDGLSDWLELDAGLDPRNPDTDHDGFSDGVEWNIEHKENGTLDPAVFNPGCAPNLIHVDSDCDGVWDCDEQLLGGNSLAVDTDSDGAPDGIEWRLGTQLAAQDLGFDPDSDGMLNGSEIRQHTDPQVADAVNLTTNGYRYNIQATGPLTDAGEQCYDFTVANVQLANALDLGRGPGYNDIYLAFSMVPADNPSAPTIMRQLRYQDARYPVTGIKSPADGVILFQPQDFHDACLPTDPATWTSVP